MGAWLALDIGRSRIGLALADDVAQLPHPAGALPNDQDLLAKLKDLIKNEDIKKLVVGLPRGLDGQETAQTKEVQDFAAMLSQHLGLAINWQDEAVTSVQAEQELESRGQPYAKEDIDALSATYILEDFIASARSVKV